MNAPPIPPVEPYFCPNCGLSLRELVEFCPACGARIENAKSRPAWLSCVMMAILALFMVPLGLAGACFLVFAPSNGVSWDSLGFGALGLVLVVAAALCGIGIAKLGKK